MIFKEIVDKTEWNEVEKKFAELYPEQEKNIEGYELVFEHLKILTPKDSRMTINIKFVEPDKEDKIFGDDEPWHDIFGTDGSMNEYLEGEEQSFAIELTEWEEWLSMKIGEETLKNYSKIDIISHCLWEMTFFGYNQEEIQGQKDELDRRVESIKDGTAELIPWEDVKSHLEEKLGIDLDKEDDK